jgi:phosphopantetheine adenylyltransferase
LPNWWTAELLVHVAKANGAKAFVRKARGAKTELVLKAHDARALEKTTESFFALAEELALAIQGTVADFCRRVPATVAEAR